MEHDFYEMYLRELEAIAPMDQEEKNLLLAGAAAGDEAARKRLVEGSLRDMIALVEEYRQRELPLSALVQEANTARILAPVA